MTLDSSFVFFLLIVGKCRFFAVAFAKHRHTGSMRSTLEGRVFKRRRHDDVGKFWLVVGDDEI